eukprot:TRINITY_DN2643_c0_g1_i1.p1 TRINITY_DN2643_c0_g1~~TRINITY_DN2643_c0_g1_i1.p1  ORF type:complete len:106 (-),score=12.92 TRINITY_DN2643_c0_g1_i1:80-397(-)
MTYDKGSVLSNYQHQCRVYKNNSKIHNKEKKFQQYSRSSQVQQHETYTLRKELAVEHQKALLGDSSILLLLGVAGTSPKRRHHCPIVQPKTAGAAALPLESDNKD